MTALPAGDSAPGETLSAQLAKVLDLEPAVRPAVEPEENEPRREAPTEAAGASPQAPEGQEQESEDITADEAPEKAAETAASDPGITKFTDLIDLLDEGATPEDLYGLEIVSSADGQPVTVGTLKDHYQQRESFNAEKAEFERQRQETVAQLEEARQQAAIAAGQNAEVPEELLQARATMQALVQQAQAVNWQELERDDPGEAALTRQKYRDAYQAAEGRYNQMQAQVEQQRQAAYQQYIAKQQEAMYQRIPDWRDQEKFNAEKAEIEQLAAQYGYTKGDIESIVDPRQAHMLRDFMRLSKHFGSATAQAKQVKERGNRILRARVKPPKGSHIQQAQERARAPNATEKDKVAAAAALLENTGIF